MPIVILVSVIRCSVLSVVLTQGGLSSDIFMAYPVNKFLYLAFCTTDYFGASFLRSVTSSGVG